VSVYDSVIESTIGVFMVLTKIVQGILFGALITWHCSALACIGGQGASKDGSFEGVNTGIQHFINSVKNFAEKNEKALSFLSNEEKIALSKLEYDRELPPQYMGELFDMKLTKDRGLVNLEIGLRQFPDLENDKCFMIRISLDRGICGGFDPRIRAIEPIKCQ
jgi:hypothetical protein